MTDPITGGCFCGDLRYELDAPLGLVANCHCGFCRRIHGAPYTTVTFIRADAFRWTLGEPRVFETPLGNLRSFCPRCASPTCNFQPPERGEFASLIVGSLDAPFQQRAWMHVNVESKLPWVDTDDGLPAFDGWPGPDVIRDLARERRGAWLPAMVRGGEG